VSLALFLWDSFCCSKLSQLLTYDILLVQLTELYSQEAKCIFVESSVSHVAHTFCHFLHFS